MEYTMVNMGWLEPGWREGIRLRTTGWLPIEWVERAIEFGVIEPREDGDSPARLTTHGLQLTDFHPHNTADENIGWLVVTFITLQFEKSWFTDCPDFHAVKIAEEMKFDRAHSEKLTAELERVVFS